MKTTIIIPILAAFLNQIPLFAQPTPWPENMVRIEETTDGGSTWISVQDPSDNINPVSTNILSDGMASAYSKVIGSQLYFRVVLRSNPETIGGLGQFAWIAQIARLVNGVWTYVAEVGVNGKPTGYSDKVYTSNASGTLINDVYEVYIGETHEFYGARVVPFQYHEMTLYYLDWQVPLSALQAVDPVVTQNTPVKLYFVTATDNNNDNKDHFRCADVCGIDWDGLRIYQLNDISLPVELVSFTADVHDNSVILTWKTATETNNEGFEIQRSREGNVWEPIGFVAGGGTVETPRTYQYVDQDVTSGSVAYRLKQIDRDGTTEFSRVINVNKSHGTDKPIILALYPNPFNPTTKLSYSLPQSQKVTVEMTDIVGRVVRTFLRNEVQKAGTHDLEIDAHNLGSGTYFITVRSDAFNLHKKVLLLK